MERRKLAALQAKWEKILAAEGLAPLDERSPAGDSYRLLLRQLDRLSREEREARADYYQRCEHFLHQLREATAVWSLYSKGHGRRGIARRLGLQEDAVRGILSRLQGIAGLTPVAKGG